MEARLTLQDKRTLVGNRVRGESLSLGFGPLGWLESGISRGSLRGFFVAGGELVEPNEERFSWQPDRITARYAFSEWALDETKTIHADVLLDWITIRNRGKDAQTVSLVFLGDFEGRKASARYAADSGAPIAGAPGDPTFAVDVDLSVSRRTHVVIGASRPPSAFSIRPYADLVTRDLIAPGRAVASSLAEPFLHDQIVLGWRFDLALDPGQSTEFAVAITCDPVPDAALARVGAALSDPAATCQAESDAWSHFFDDEIPIFHCSDPALERLWLYSWYVQRSNVVFVGERRFPWPFQVPSKHTYPHLWLWDSAFHALITRWLRDPLLAQDDLRSAALQQYPNGMIPHETYLEPDTAWGNWPDGDGQSSSITQLPIFAHAAWEVFRVCRDRTLLSDLYPGLLRYDDWWRRERDRDGDGLVSLVHPWEGWDTSPRWDWGMDVEPVDVNCFYCAQKQALANMAAELGDRRREVHYREEAARVAESIRGKMWDPTARTFFDLQGESEAPVHVRTPAAFITLPFGIADASQADALMAQLVDPRLFWPRFPIPTVALDEPTFAPKDYWRGPVWFNQNWLVVDGLRRYRRDDLAAQLLRRTLDLLTLHGRPSNHEYFDPLTGEGLGAVDLGWTGLCNDLIIRHVCGVQPGSPEPFKPLDIGLDWYELQLPSLDIHIRFDRDKGYRQLDSPRPVRGRS